ncbi:MAG TPA: Gfo/Idh/MocA family oxidoreductase [Humisphaera sp.]|nr:Gfo/Idh/MocA family oxidoreductase [Humisphaera sp.]
MIERITLTIGMIVCGISILLFVTGQARAADEVTQVALVGSAHIHTPDFAARLIKRTDVKVKSVWDRDPALAAQYAKQLNAAVVSDVNVIWNDPTIKAVIICSQTNQHLELVTAAARAKKQIYAEKPLGMGAADAYAMARAIDDAGLLFQTGYFMRGDPKLQFLKEQMQKGAFGKITRIRGSNAHNGALAGWFDKEYRWMADPKQSGVGGYGDLGTHALDLMLWLMNEPVVRVTATTSPGTARYENCDELGEGILIFKGGTIGTLAAGWDDVANPVTLEIAGTEGHAVIMNDQLYFQTKKVAGATGKEPWKDLPQKQAHPFDLFLDAVVGKGTAGIIGADEAAYRAAVMDALYQGAKGQKWADVQQPTK